MIAPPVIERPPEVYNYLDKFTLHKGDKVIVRSRSYCVDSEGNKTRTGVNGTYYFSCVVAQGIMVTEYPRSDDNVGVSGSSAGIFVYLGKERKLDMTSSILRPHILSLPTLKKKTKKVKKNEQE